MKFNSRMAVAVVAAFGLGAVMIEGLHAQAPARPSIIQVSEINVSNTDGYLKEYAPKTQAAIKKAGGRFLAAGGKVTNFEGQAVKGRVVLIAWESVEKYQAYRDSAENKELRKVGNKYGKFRIYAVEALPQ